MSTINPIAVVRLVNQNVKHKFGENDVEPTQDDIKFADIIFNMIIQRQSGDVSSMTAIANSLRYPPPMNLPCITPGMMAVNPFAATGWRPPMTTPAPTTIRPMISEADIQRRAYLTQVSAELRERAVDWQEYKTSDQKLFYFNTKTTERTWNKPSVIQELDDAIAVIKEQKANKATQEANSKSYQQQSQQTSVQDANKQQGSSSSKNSGSMKPVSTMAIPGTPWCVVWTDQKRVFYFNPSTKTSVWDRPAELRNREDVDRMVSNPNNPNTSNATNDVNSNSSASDEPSGQNGKHNMENNGNTNSNMTTVAMTTATTNRSESSEVKLVKKEVNSEIEKDAARKRETIPFKERVETFRKMLKEKDVDPTSTFRNELSKIVFDSRYLLLTSDERRETFDRYCQENERRFHQSNERPSKKPRK